MGSTISIILGVILYANLPSRYIMRTNFPSIQYLSETKLKHIKSENDVLLAPEIKARKLFDHSPLLVMVVRRTGCAFCRKEASLLSNLSEQLQQRGVRLIGIVHEAKGVDAFQSYLKGDIYYDAEKRFYGPTKRWMPLWVGLLRWSTYLHNYKINKDQYKGNYEGEGRLLGGVFLINHNKIIYGHLEKEWGDQVDIDALNAALKTIS